MLEGLYQIGLTRNFNVLDDSILPINESYKYVVKIQLKKENDFYIFKKVDFEQMSIDKKNNYGLMEGSSRGSARTPVTLSPFEKNFLKNGIEDVNAHINSIIIKKFEQKILNSIQEFIKSFNPEKSDKEELQKVDKTLQDSKEAIEESLKDFFIKNENIRKNNKVLLVSFVIENNEYYPGDFPPIKRTIENSGKDVFISYYKKNNIESVSNKKYCFYCHEIKEEVWGYASPFTFYTVDKQSFVSGGFNQELAWKNYPVCPDCAIKLHIGEKYLSEKLKFNFAGYNYYLIPQLLFFDNNQMTELLTRLEYYPTLSTKTTEEAKIYGIEEYILKKLSEESNLVNFNFMFFEVNNNAFNILLLIQEIPPSRLKELINKKDEVDKKYRDFLSEINTKRETIDFNFHFSFIFEFFKGKKQDVDFNKAALEILRNIFYIKPVSFSLLLDRFLAKIRNRFTNGDEFDQEVFILKALKITLYLEELNILDRRKYIMSAEKPLDDFLGNFPILDEPTKRAVFLEGVLALKLLNIQYREKNSKPFYSRLNGLKIDEKVAKRLLPEMINKLEEYEKNYYKELENAISYYFAQSNFNNFTVDELSFYFALGLSLGKHYKKEDKEEEKNA